MTGDALAKLFSQVSYAVGKNDSRSILKSVMLKFGMGRMTAVALDGFRLALVEQNNSEIDGEEQKIIIPDTAVGTVISLASAEKNNEVTVCAGNGRMALKGNSFELNSTLLSGEYIDYNRIINKDSKTIAQAPVKDLKEALERSMVVSGKEMIRMSLGADGIALTSNSKEDIASIYEEIDAGVMGEDLNIAFNPVYLRDALNAIPDDCPDFHLSTAVNPAYFSGDTADGSYVHLLLPVRIMS